MTTKKDLALKMYQAYVRAPWDSTRAPDWEALADVAAQVLGVELAPEQPPAERRPEWWGGSLFVDAVGSVLQSDFSRSFGSAVVLCTGPDGVVSRRALVAAYEAARKAGVLPGLETQSQTESAAPERPALPGWAEEELRVSGGGVIFAGKRHVFVGAQPMTEREDRVECIANRTALVEVHRRWLAAKRLLEQWLDRAGAPGLDEHNPSAARAMRDAAAILRGEEV